MKSRHALVTMGSPSFREVRAPLVEVVSAWFPPNARLASHTHAKAVFGVMLDGTFRTRILGRDVDYLAAGAWTEPAEERHTNVAGSTGARVLIVQPGSADSALADVCRSLLEEVVYIRSLDLMADASRLEAECTVPDELSALVVEGTALAMLARAARLQRRELHHDHAPRWLHRAVEYLHAHCLDRINLGALATSVGVHPSRLAHEFRTRLGVSPGEYVRRLRLEWAAGCLREPEPGIAEVAVRAGLLRPESFLANVSPALRRQSGAVASSANDSVTRLTHLQPRDLRRNPPRRRAVRDPQVVRPRIDRQVPAPAPLGSAADTS